MSKFKLIDSDYDSRVYERIIMGRLTYKRYKYMRRKARIVNNAEHRCGCPHDCCGCLCATGMRLDIIPGGVKLTYQESFNY